ncbi:uncharacterized protein F4812DRAFT_322439 [Daldinia caldariorum]|uniref:uncharacterized protein n=1 Tax=Daldinia caldariorum TaxID=326644 RepID=UPI00200753BE|nr:uncharacterized protein F4812DRAFT_322439 [Daldinia caldariorum]KAI1469214.1 hypothetical protein F4812DRAFT_322439 [Daldinia caldariorum]
MMLSNLPPICPTILSRIRFLTSIFHKSCSTTYFHNPSSKIHLRKCSRGGYIKYKHAYRFDSIRLVCGPPYSSTKTIIHPSYLPQLRLRNRLRDNCHIFPFFFFQDVFFPKRISLILLMMALSTESIIAIVSVLIMCILAGIKYLPRLIRQCNAQLLRGNPSNPSNHFVRSSALESGAVFATRRVRVDETFMLWSPYTSGPSRNSPYQGSELEVFHA